MQKHQYQYSKVFNRDLIIYKTTLHFSVSQRYLFPQIFPTQFSFCAYHPIAADIYKWASKLVSEDSDKKLTAVKAE